MKGKVTDGVLLVIVLVILLAVVLLGREFESEWRYEGLDSVGRVERLK